VSETQKNPWWPATGRPWSNAVPDSSSAVPDQSNAKGQPSDQGISELWMRMIESYGHRWTSQYGEIPRPGDSNPAMETWAKGLTGISPRHMRLGLNKAVKNGDPWPPSLPAFRGFCRPQLSDFDLPEPSSAWAQARSAMGGPNRRQSWLHPALRLAARHARKGPSGSHEKRFLAAYRHLCQRVFDGTPLTDPLPDALLPSPEPPASPEEARRHLAQLKAMIHGGKTGAT